MNQAQIKRRQKPLAIILSLSFAILAAVLITLAYIFGSDPARVSATIFVAIVPSAAVVWLCLSLLAYVICKYKGNIPRSAEVNLKASSILVAVLLLIAVFAMFVSVIAFGVHPIELISQYFN